MNTARSLVPINIQPAVTALLISPFADDHAVLRHVSASGRRDLNSAFARSEAIGLIRRAMVPVVVCVRDLPDGDWKAVPGATVVASSFDAREAEVDAREAEVKVQHALRSWRVKWRKTPSRLVRDARIGSG